VAEGVGEGLGLLVHRMRPAAGEPDGALVLLHGRGVDESDLFPLLDALDPERRLAGATPRGPLTLPPGGFHWYIVERVGYPHRETFMQTYETLTTWLDSFAEETGIPWARTVIGGFSQGAVMSYALGLGKGRPPPAGILAMSGFMPTVEGFELDLSNRQGYPVAIYHGSLDPVIGVEWGRQARDRLVEAGADVLYREAPAAHNIDPREIPVLAEWVSQTVAGDPAKRGGTSPPPG
jgi:phospholipase/carboxylesterase